MQTTIEYITQIRLQQAINPLFPKQDNSLSTFYLPYTKQKAFDFLENKPFNYLSCRFIKGYYYWEFVNSNNISNFVELEFLYILVSNSTFTKYKTKIPYYSTWDKAKQTKLIYPNISYLMNSNSVSWGSYYSIESTTNTHPFLSTLKFTGKVCLLNQTLLYEYQDSKGYYAQKDYLYLSPLRPLNLNYPLGTPTSEQLVVDECELDEAYPTSGDSYFVGEYQGQYTNSLYNKHIKFYLYANSTSQFLLQQPPKLNYKWAAMTALSLVGVEPTLRLPTTISTQEFTINQTITTPQLTIT
jgi:hypothetical protein